MASFSGHALRLLPSIIAHPCFTWRGHGWNRPEMSASPPLAGLYHFLRSTTDCPPTVHSNSSNNCTYNIVYDVRFSGTKLWLGWPATQAALSHKEMRVRAPPRNDFPECLLCSYNYVPGNLSGTTYTCTARTWHIWQSQRHQQAGKCETEDGWWSSEKRHT